MMPSSVLKAKSANSIYEFEALGTRWSIETPALISSFLRQKILQNLDDFCADYSRFLPESWVNRIYNLGPGEYAVPQNFAEIFSYYEKLFTATDGAISPLVGKKLRDLGYDETYSFDNKLTISTVEDFSKTLSLSGGVLSATSSVLLDIGAAGKGFAVDRVAALLKKNKIEEYVIDASGDISYATKKPNAFQKIGLQNPTKPDEVLGFAMVRNQSLCASASTIRRWRNSKNQREFLHHIVDARTGEPTQNIIATWVIADSTFVADGLASALFFAEPEALKDVAPFQFVRLHASGKIEYSDNFKGEIFV